MISSIEEYKTIGGIAGFVFGILKQDKTIDEDRMDHLVQLSRPLKAVCHKAFDETIDFNQALEALQRIGIDELLTSGRHKVALDGA